MKKIILTRKQLHDLVWSNPLSSLAKKYSISDNGLRKICVKMEIPLPPNGHWQKVRFGKPVTTIELPDKFPGKDEIIIGEFANDEDQQDTPLAILRRTITEIENTKGLPLKVPERLSNPDQLTTVTKNFYDAVDRYHKSGRDYSHYPEAVDMLNIDVLKENLPRAYRLMDTIVKLLKVRNHSIKFTYKECRAVVEGEEIEFRLREKMRVSSEKDKWGGKVMESTGEFVFIIGHYPRYEIKDGYEKLENKISSILARLELEGKRQKEERIKWEKYRKEQEERERIARELKERKDKEAGKFKELFSQATRLHQANILRDYILTVESLALNNGVLTEELENWIKWSKEKVEWYDPLINREDPLLNDKYKISIFKDFLKEWQ